MRCVVPGLSHGRVSTRPGEYSWPPEEGKGCTVALKLSVWQPHALELLLGLVEPGMEVELRMRWGPPSPGGWAGAGKLVCSHAPVF